MIAFKASSADGTELAGRHWPAKNQNPKAVMALVHGFGEHCGRYAHMAAHLNANGIAVIALDLHGHGETAGKRGVIKSYDDFRDDLAALLAEMRRIYPTTPEVLYGHSMGGAVVLDYGLRTQDAMPIISSAPLISLAQPVPKALQILTQLMGRINPKGAMSQPIDGTKVSNLKSEQEAYMSDPLNHGTMGFRLAEGMVKTGEAIAALAAEWDRPLLLMHSKDDQLTGFAGSANFAKAAKHVEFHAFESVQHEMHNDASRDEVYALMTAFILKQAGAKTS